MSARRATRPHGYHETQQPHPALVTTMFNPSRDEVRRFFTDTWRKQRAGEILTPLEAIAADWIVEHPEYHAELTDADAAAAQDY